MGQRSTILTRLPFELRKELDQRLVENGFRGYLELTRWLNGLGYGISKGALNRYGIALERRQLDAAAAIAQAQALAQTAGSDEVIATEALTRLVQERLFGVLLETERPLTHIDLARLARLIGDLTRTTISHRRWTAEGRARLAQQRGAAASEAKRNEHQGAAESATRGPSNTPRAESRILDEVASLERAGGLSSAAAESIRALLLTVDPFPDKSP